MRKGLAIKTVSKGRQGAVLFYLNCTSESSGGSGVRGCERRRRSGSRESKQRASVNAQGHAGYDGLNQIQGGGQYSPRLVAGVRLCSGGARAIAGSLGAFLSGFVGGNDREGEVVL